MKVGIVEKAENFASQAHNSTGQIRKYSGEPFINHPKRVVETLIEFTNDEITLASAWLHDVVEDTPVTIEDIKNEFGTEIATIIRELTVVNIRKGKKVKMNLEEQINHYHKASNRAHTIKLADIMDNIWDIIDADPKKALSYIPEKKIIVSSLAKGNFELRKIAIKKIEYEVLKLEQIKVKLFD